MKSRTPNQLYPCPRDEGIISTYLKLSPWGRIFGLRLALPVNTAILFFTENGNLSMVVTKLAAAELFVLIFGASCQDFFSLPVSV